MKKKKPVKIITLDTETYNGLIGDLKRIAIYDGNKITYGYKFTDIEPEIIKFHDGGFDVHVYIHNLEFDARKISEIFSPDRIIWEKSFIINNKFATIATKNYTIHDSFKILPMALAKLSKDFNVEHGKLSLWDEVQKVYPDEYTDIVDFLDRCDIDNELYLKYLGYDVMSLYEVIEVVLNLSHLSLHDFVKRISTASLSRFIFKNGYNGSQFKSEKSFKTDYDIMCSYKWHNDLETEEFIRCSYCGGRTEVFKPKLDEAGKHYDVNSLYPYVMSIHDFPIGSPEMFSESEIAQEMFENWMENHDGLGFVSCSVYIPYQHIPPLPVKMGKLTFPCGFVYGTWTYTELEYAIKNCGVEVITYREVCHFSRTFPVFKRFIDMMYQIKEKGTVEKNEALRSFGKLLMNVGYGYTGMNRDKTQLRDIREKDKYDEITFINDELGYIEVPADIKSEYIQVQVASYVTSYARLVLLDALLKADKLGEVYYCDTDSIVTNITFPDEIVDSKKLGFWDLESKPIKALFLRPKVYCEIMEEKTNVKFKGISKDTQKTLSYDDYEILFEELQTMKNDYKIIEKNKLMLRSVMYMINNDIDFSHYEMRNKRMNFKTIEKRVMNYNENYTKPHFFASEQEFENFNYNRKPLVSIDFMRG